MDNYQIIKPAGEGSFGQVFKARRKLDGRTVAIKAVRKKGRSEKELLSFRRECDIQKTLRHPNIIQMIDTFETEGKIVVVTEYVEMELYALLKKSGCLSEIRASVVACDLLSALHYLHSKRIVHRDIKPQNVLIDGSGVCKLCDFGFARVMSKTTYVLQSVKGTPLYMAPELMDEQPYDHTVDLWSLGCIIYELVTGATPFQTTNLRELVQLVRSAAIKWPDYISTECQSFLAGLLQKNRQSRLTWPSLLHHPFVAGRILVRNKDESRPLTSPLSQSEDQVKQYQIQSLASRITNQSRKLIGKQFQKLKSSSIGDPDTSVSIDDMLNNLSLRVSLQSDLAEDGHATNCQTDCSDQEKETIEQKSQTVATYGNQNNLGFYEHQGFQLTGPCCLKTLQQEANAAALVAANSVYQQWKFAYNNSNFINQLSPLVEDFKKQSESRISSEQKSMVAQKVRLPNWIPQDDIQPIENEEWAASLRSSMEEAFSGDMSMLLQKNCVSLFTTHLKNPGVSPRCTEWTAYLLATPLLGESDVLTKVQETYLSIKVVPDLIYTVRILCLNNASSETESLSINSWSRAENGLSGDILRALESIMMVLCTLTHLKNEFIIQFCDALFVVPEGIPIFQRLLGLERRKPRVVSDLIAILSEILRSQTGNVELVEQILTRNKSKDELVDLFTKLLSHKHGKLRARVCTLLLLLGKLSPKSLQLFWCKALKDLLESFSSPITICSEEEEN